MNTGTLCKKTNSLLNPILRFFVSFISVAAGCFCFFWISLGDNLFHLNSRQLDMAGDGFKNYFSFAYQYKFGSGIHFDGFMYPYGDLVTYADGQILFVWILQGLEKIGIDSENYLLGIINILPLISFVICGLILIRIFEHYKVDYPYAVLFSIVAIALSPQIFRVQSHYALAYAYLIPLLWWFNLQINGKKSDVILYTCLSCLILLAHGFVHPYLIFIGSLFLLSLWVANLFIHRNLSPPILIQAVVPLVIFMVTMNVIDPILDRPKNPYGLMIHKTEVSDLLPFHGWFNYLFKDALSLRSDYSEGYTYPGMLLFAVPALLFVRRVMSRKLDPRPLNLPKNLWTYFTSGILCLAFGMGLHVILTGGLILDLIPQLKQFRSMGRVSWVFYYVAFVFLAILLFRIINSFNSKSLKWSLLGLVLLLWSADIYSYHKSLNKIVSTYASDDLLNNSKQIANLLAEENISADRYQALWVLPSSSEGTEKISFRDDWSSKMNAIPYAYQTGLPLTSIVMSRSSISNSLKVMQLSSSNYVEKEIVKDFANGLPLLIILQNDRLKLFEDILAKSRFIGKVKDFSLYEIAIDSLADFQRHEVESDFIVDSEISQPNLFLNFEEGNNGGLLSKGNKLINGSIEIFEIELSSPDSSMYSLSLWYQIIKDNSNVPHFNFQTLAEDKTIRQDHHFRDWDMNRVEVIGDWIRLKQDFILDSDDRFVKLIANGNHINLDRVLFKQDSIQVMEPTQDPKFYQWNHAIVQREF